MICWPAVVLTLTYYVCIVFSVSDRVDCVGQLIIRHIAVESSCLDIRVTERILNRAHPDACCVQSRSECPAT